MPPKFLVEMPAGQVDYTNSLVKTLSISLGQAAYFYFVDGTVPNTAQMTRSFSVAAAGLLVYHMIVDPLLVRAIPRASEEGYYAARKRFE